MIAIIVTKQQHIQIRMCTKTNKRTYCSSNVNITMYCIFHRNQYLSGVVSRRHWSVVVCILVHEFAVTTIVSKQQHIQIRMCTKTNKRTLCSSKVIIYNNVSYIPPQSISIRSCEPSPLECGSMVIGSRVYVHQNK